MLFSSKKVHSKELKYGNYRKRYNWSNEAFRHGKAIDKCPTREMQSAVETALVKDVYLKLHPYMAVVNLLNKNQLNMMQMEIRRILADYGDRDIVFAPRGAQLPASLSREMIELSKDAILVKEQCSMSMKDFLFITKGAIIVPPHIVEEWSGIPVDMQKEIYEEIVNYFRRVAASSHDKIFAETS